MILITHFNYSQSIHFTYVFLLYYYINIFPNTMCIKNFVFHYYHFLSLSLNYIISSLLIYFKYLFKLFYIFYTNSLIPFLFNILFTFSKLTVCILTLLQVSIRKSISVSP